MITSEQIENLKLGYIDVYSIMESESNICQVYKVIELEDKQVDHSGDYPYVQSCHVDKQVVFTLRTTKTYQHMPILVMDSCETDKMTLPLTRGQDLDTIHNCQILQGKFDIDGGWHCKYQLKQPGLLYFQLVFVYYGKKIITDLGSFDCILQVQNKVELRKLRKLTLFPRCIGKIQDWDAFCRKQIDLGYNAFHFAPIQQTGFSKSYYSIYDQLTLASDIFSGQNSQRFQQLKQLLDKYQKQGIIFFIDIVLNHTSFDSEWIKEDQNSVFTVENTPELQSAYELDQALHNWGDELKGNLADQNIEMDDNQFEIIKEQIGELVENLKLHQFFQIDEKIAVEFVKALAPRQPSENIFAKDPSQLVLEFIQKNCDGLGKKRVGVEIKNLCEKWKKLDYLYQANDVLFGIRKFNKKWKNTIKNEWQPQIKNNLLGQIRYHYLQNKNRSYSDNLPFINPYFSRVVLKTGKTISALNNGWVMGADTNQNLVTTKKFYYLRRRVSVWGDLIRIRYGNNPQDSPAWTHMKNYVHTMAKYFDGFRLDNLHGTQLNVAQIMIKEARKIKPEIIVFAELFATTEREKIVFIRTSGVNSTLFELKNYLSGQQFIQLFHQSMGNQGKYTGSISPHFERTYGQKVKYCKRKKPIPLIYDQTHDNCTYQQTGKIVIKTPIAIITQFCGAFVGSTKGFDQFYSKRTSVTETKPIYQQDVSKSVKEISVSSVNKKFVYDSTNPRDKVELFGNWNNWREGKLMNLSGKIGFEISIPLTKGTYQYKYLVNGKWMTDSKKPTNQQGNHTITITPSNKYLHSNLQMLRKGGGTSRQKYFTYNQYFVYHDGQIVVLLRQKKNTRQSLCIIINLSTEVQQFVSPVQLPGVICSTEIWVQSSYSMYQGLTTDVEIINSTEIGEYFDYYFSVQEQKQILLANDLPPGFGCIIQCKKTSIVLQALTNICQLQTHEIVLPTLGPLDYNLIMYGVESEEQARFHSTNFYLPSEKRRLIFGGFGGIIAQLQKAKRWNILSCGIFDSIREGNWLIDYYITRLKRFKHLNNFTDIVEKYFEYLKKVPSYLRPKYFTDFVYKIYKKIQQQISGGNKNRFHRKILLATTQFISSFQAQNPLFRVTLSAGLPHFSTGWARCWGRDTFMSNQLLLLYPGIYSDIILQFASALRHGMIPNLLDFGVNPRYNCRDACWWFIRGVKQYMRLTKDYQILKAKVNMLFLSNDLMEHREKVNRGLKKVMSVEEIIQNIFQSHADGITYRQWNAGYEIDTNMTSHGFSIHLEVDDETGFIVGGNAENCLTWMDKMGSSGRAGNKGFPATSRAGAPIQLTALVYHCLVEYDKLNKEGYYSYNSVKFEKLDITYDYWANRIKQNFQQCYWIDEKKTQKTKYENIYKDVVSSPFNLLYQQFRLRPNALIALALTPQLLDPDHALKYLEVVQKQLIFQHSIGVSTLGQAHDSLFVSYYDNEDDSTDVKVAHGYSYHNGPQWIWLYGFYIKAKCNFNRELKRNQLYALLQNQARFLYANDWGSLPELTNRNGDINRFSCQSQAWSISSMLLAINSINEYEP